MGVISLLVLSKVTVFQQSGGIYTVYRYLLESVIFYFLNLKFSTSLFTEFFDSLICSLENKKSSFCEKNEN